MSEFYVWITCMLPSYEDSITAGMVKKGYHVGPAADDNVVTLFKKENASALITLRVASGNEELTAQKVHEDIVGVLNENSFLYYSVIVSACTMCCWVSSNIVIPQRASVIPPPLPTPDKSNLN